MVFCVPSNCKHTRGFNATKVQIPNLVNERRPQQSIIEIETRWKLKSSFGRKTTFYSLNSDHANIENVSFYWDTKQISLSVFSLKNDYFEAKEYIDKLVKKENDQTDPLPRLIWHFLHDKFCKADILSIRSQSIIRINFLSQFQIFWWVLWKILFWQVERRGRQNIHYRWWCFTQLHRKSFSNFENYASF